MQLLKAVLKERIDIVCYFYRAYSYSQCAYDLYTFDVRGSVHHSTIHTEKSNKMQQCIKIYYSIFMWSPTCFGRHTVHYQEAKSALAASGFAYMEGCWTCGCCTLSGRA